MPLLLVVVNNLDGAIEVEADGDKEGGLDDLAIDAPEVQELRVLDGLDERPELVIVGRHG